MQKHVKIIKLREGDRPTEFFPKIIWSVEASLNLSDYANRHNCTYWYAENHRIGIGRGLNEPGVNIWGSISCHGVIEPWFFDETVTREKYQDKLTTYVIWGLQLNFYKFNSLYFQQDGAPPRYPTAVK